MIYTVVVAARETEKESKGEREYCALARFTRARIFTISSDYRHVCICVYVHVCTRLCGECLEKVLRSRYLFFGSLEPPVMIIGAT